jgi:hypothetical protein
MDCDEGDKDAGDEEDGDEVGLGVCESKSERK